MLSTSGNPQKLDAGSVLGVRVDFTGPVEKSALIHYGIYDAAGALEMPWGSKRKADTVVKAESAEYRFRFAAFAPVGWSGKAVISYMMRNTGEGSWVKPGGGVVGWNGPAPIPGLYFMKFHKDRGRWIRAFQSGL